MLGLIPFFTTEAQLLAALRRGENRAYKIVYERFSGRMMAVCVRYCANRAARTMLQVNLKKMEPESGPQTHGLNKFHHEKTHRKTAG